MTEAGSISTDYAAGRRGVNVRRQDRWFCHGPITTASHCRRAADEILELLLGSDLAKKLLDLAAQLETNAKAMADGPAPRHPPLAP
jgi:hypothetical protein